MKHLKITIVALIAIIFAMAAINNIVSINNGLTVKDLNLETDQSKLKSIQLQQKNLNNNFDKAILDKDINEAKVKDLEKQRLELEKKQKQLESQLQARLEEKAKAAQAIPVTAVAYAATAPSGSKEQWMAAAGIPQDDWWAVDYIVTRESGWNPNSMNSSSGACSLVQALPCSKIGPNWRDPVTALKWQFGYVNARFGGYAGAVSYWKVNGNY